MSFRVLAHFMSLVVLVGLARAEDSPRERARAALEPLADLIGTWRAVGSPEGSFREKQKGTWKEALTWGWQFKGDDAWLAVSWEDGKHFRKGTLRPLPKDQGYQFVAVAPDGGELAYQGTLAGRVLTLAREDPATGDTHRLVFTLLHPNRFTYRGEVVRAGRNTPVKLFEVGATKEGEAFAAGSGGPECVVTGGRGTIRVTHKGETYYVCCSGCRDAFNEDPEKILKEYAERKAKEKAKKSSGKE